MNAIDQMTYRARAGGAGIIIVQTASTIRDQQQAERWQRWLDPWLRAGHPRGSAYLDFTSQAAFIRWQDTRSRLPWEHALVLAGPPAALSGISALELPEPDWSGTALATPEAVQAQARGQRRAAIERRARSADAMSALIPLLAHALGGERHVIMPWTEPGLPEAVMWGLISILRMMGDNRPVSFLTYGAAARRDVDTPGLLVSFSTNAAAPLPPDHGFMVLANNLADRFADDPADLGLMLTEHGLPQAADHNDRINLLLGLRSLSQPANLYPERSATVSANFGQPIARADPAVSAASAASPQSPQSAVMCPICLTDIPDWDALDYWSFGADGDYEKIEILPNANPTQQARLRLGAYVRCPGAAGDTTAVHHLPARYGRFGAPVLLGFIGLTESGKSHLLTSMIGGISKLSGYQIGVEPLDPAMHHRFLENSVKPLITRNEVLPGTPDDATTDIADAFIIRHRNGSERVVALFDVSGGVLAQGDRPGKTREFLWIADGLFFVIDPGHINTSKIGDDTFSNVLNIVRNRPKPEPVSAAIVLTKADKARFEEPVARWLRSGDGTLDPTEFLRESADVYAYLQQHEAAVLTEPYQVCPKTTLHVASSTGGAKEGEEKGSKYPRGVTPQRVLRPLVAMLAMTGVLAGPQAEMIGF